MSITSPTPKLRVETAFGVARLFIDNAAKRNAFDFDMWRALPPLMKAIEDEPEARVLVISGAPGLSFCSGADISEFSTVRATSDGGRAYEAANVEAFDAISNLSKPTIAAISGFCMGGGMGLAAACDLRVAQEGAVFSIPAAKLGVGYPPSAMRYVVAAVGPQLAFDLFFTARRLSAREARDAGFLVRLMEQESFIGAVHELAESIADNAPLTLKAAKAAIRAAAALPGALSPEGCEALAAACFDSADYEEGRAAFLDKRSPKFRGS
ncbi:enoyl-CoA hydratase/isomerase family protein [Methylocystis sp. WRRC1]|uniref:enoyl-CoA hydratase n=1 Tax=Methylocystis sp. WRRC1 TaxID=1732014 RepID=UPI001D1367EC|nr:enoyl-CoA hydratase [Methylocystis sp. WRRC1]MCC3244772.1 enoyl-CoA hydratase/isomerase family protein [Methylocystis sp. WRRC1]